MDNVTMQIQVLLFAAVREAAGSDTLTIDVPDDARVVDVIDAVGKSLPSVASLMPACRVAIDSCYANAETTVPAGSEVALIPPVSGG